MAAEQIEVQLHGLYERYLDALARTGRPPEPGAPAGHVVRLCAHCGMRALFAIDPRGMWAECTHCRRYA